MVEDTFTRAASLSLGSDWIEVDSSGGVIQINAFDDVQMGSANAALDAAFGLWFLNFFVPDSHAAAVVTEVGGWAGGAEGPCVNVDPDSTVESFKGYALFQVAATTWRVFEFNNAALKTGGSQLGVDIGMAAGAEHRLEIASGQALNIYRAGVLVTTRTGTLSTPPKARAGICARNNPADGSGIFDTWRGTGEIIITPPYFISKTKLRILP